MHARQQIREDIVAAIDAATTANVYDTRYLPVTDEQMPCVMAYFASEDVLLDQSALGTLTYRTIRMVLEIRATAITGVEDTIDSLCETVEAAMYSAVLPVKDIQLVGTEFSVEADGDRPYGLAAQEWAVEYLVDSAAPGSLL